MGLRGDAYHKVNVPRHKQLLHELADGHRRPVRRQPADGDGRAPLGAAQVAPVAEYGEIVGQRARRGRRRQRARLGPPARVRVAGAGGKVCQQHVVEEAAAGQAVGRAEPRGLKMKVIPPIF